jgi:hypothetical protein
MMDLHSLMTKRREEMARSYVRIPTIMLAMLFFCAGLAQAQSGNLEPPASAYSGANPTPTTQTQPSWDQTLPAAERFVLVMGGAAVLDKETGLVWEQSPLTTRHNWQVARFQCTSRTVGGRKGWRLPSVHELASLLDPGNPTGNPDLPVGHPFSNVQSSSYWSATQVDTQFAWIVMLRTGDVINDVKANDIFFVWCVRGGQNHGSVY